MVTKSTTKRPTAKVGKKTAVPKTVKKCKTTKKQTVKAVTNKRIPSKRPIPKRTVSVKKVKATPSRNIKPDFSKSPACGGTIIKVQYPKFDEKTHNHILVYRPGTPEPYVVGRYYNVNTGNWANGHYYKTLEDANNDDAIYGAKAVPNNGILKYWTICRENGDPIDEFKTYQAAEKAIEKYEKEDKKDGSYVPRFYDIRESVEDLTKVKNKSVKNIPIETMPDACYYAHPITEETIVIRKGIGGYCTTSYKDIPYKKLNKDLGVDEDTAHMMFVCSMGRWK